MKKRGADVLHLNGRDPTSILLKRKSVIINSVEYFVKYEGKKTTTYLFEGIYYDTIEELWIAEMLYRMGIPFLHHVNFSFPLKEEDSGDRIWCPDFVFGAPFRWTGKICNGSVIVGIEVKKKKTNGARQRSRALVREEGIPIIILKRKQVKPYYDELKTLPLKPLAIKQDAVA